MVVPPPELPLLALVLMVSVGITSVVAVAANSEGYIKYTLSKYAEVFKPNSPPDLFLKPTCASNANDL